MPTIMTTTGASLVPSVPGYDPAELRIVLDLEGRELFQGLPQECEQYMLAEGLRPHCNCELTTPDAAGVWLSAALGWA